MNKNDKRRRRTSKSERLKEENNLNNKGKRQTRNIKGKNGSFKRTHTKKSFKTNKKKDNRLKLFFLFALILIIYLGYINSKSSDYSYNDIKRPAVISPAKGKVINRFEEEINNANLNSKVLSVVNLKDNILYYSKSEDRVVPSASLAKLFSIAYASTIISEYEEIEVTGEAIALVKEGSSSAGLVPGRYSVRDIYAGMLIPSGNDAAYVLASYVGGKLNPRLNTATEKIDYFLSNLNMFLKSKGYFNTVITDPSGYEPTSVTTAKELSSVIKGLNTKMWFNDISKHRSYAVTLSDGRRLNWNNTNMFMDKDSKFYNPNVIGVKTGSLSVAYNLATVYVKGDDKYLIISLKSGSDEARYKDVKKIISIVEEYIN